TFVHRGLSTRHRFFRESLEPQPPPLRRPYEICPVALLNFGVLPFPASALDSDIIPEEEMHTLLDYGCLNEERHPRGAMGVMFSRPHKAKKTRFNRASLYYTFISFPDAWNIKGLAAFAKDLLPAKNIVKSDIAPPTLPQRTLSSRPPTRNAPVAPQICNATKPSPPPRSTEHRRVRPRAALRPSRRMNEI
ncbi:hypothetical protein K443DRAFT_90728, partial [Laccaria amethystina LaAM-08-1]